MRNLLLLNNSGGFTISFDYDNFFYGINIFSKVTFLIITIHRI